MMLIANKFKLHPVRLLMYSNTILNEISALIDPLKNTAFHLFLYDNTIPILEYLKQYTSITIFCYEITPNQIINYERENNVDFPPIYFPVSQFLSRSEILEKSICSNLNQLGDCQTIVSSLWLNL